jgi:hypothetical protein
VGVAFAHLRGSHAVAYMTFVAIARSSRDASAAHVSRGQPRLGG